MSERKDGGQAFPPGGFGKGMTLRDWLAGQALVGAMTTVTNLGEAEAYQRRRVLDQLAAILYEVADAMIAARDA